jgi:hypothetical protein
MFYEIKEKRVKTGSQTKWWLTAAFSAIFLTTVFIALIFWLGVNVRQPESSFADRHSAFREYQQYIAPQPSTTVGSKLEYPTAEILKTTIKNKKGRVEMVEVSSEKPTPKSVSTSSTSRTASTETSTSTQTSLEIDIEDEADSYSMDQQSPDVQLRSKISKLSNAQMEYAAASDKSHLQDGINPLEESSPVPSFENSSVKKKSEAVLPSWFDPSLQSNQPKTDPSNHLKQDTVYDLPDFSQIKPDLSAFNTKTIPAFTYLKEPIPQFGTLSEASNEDSGANVDESYYYQQATRTDSPQITNKTPENSFLSFLQKRLHNMQDWLLYGGKKNNSSVDLMELVKAFNSSFQTKRIGTIFSKVKDFYTNFNSSDVHNLLLSNLLYTPQANPNILSNSSSLVSFGLLAIDLFLLHNVQQIVWNEEAKIGEEMLKDPEVVALNALFMSPERIKQLRSTNSRVLTDREKKGVVHDILEFINGGLRAVLNLSKAYKSSTARSNNARSQSNGSTLDCIWTLYCRNLDKTAKLDGPYGFLAKMNR